MTSGIHHVGLVCRDGERTAKFYRDLLGLRVVEQAGRSLWFGDSAARPGTLLAFLEQPDARAGRWGVGGVHHVALGVATSDAQLKWKRRLADHGVRVSGPLDRGWFDSIYFADPDGQVLEIATAGPGYDLDEPVDALGSRLVIPDQERLRGFRDEQQIRDSVHPEPVPEITPDMELQGIHHISGITDDIDAAHRFYTQAVGLRLVKRTANQDDPSTPHLFWAAYDGRSVAPHSSMTLFGWPPGRRRAVEGVGQTHHVAFRAADLAEQLAWREHLLGMGVQVTPVPDNGPSSSVRFSAPDGMLLEIATDGPGF